MKALITGGTRGIGRAIVEALLPRLTELTVVARDQQHLDALNDRVAREFSGCRFEAIQQDIGDLDGLGEALKVWRGASERPLDVLVLNAGTYTEGDLAGIPMADYLRDLDVNLNANLVAVQELLPCLRAGRKKRIFITGSTAAYEAYPLVPTYGIAKAGLRALAVNLRHELAPERIGVTFVSPGGTLTDMWAGEDLPDNRLLQPSDIGVLVAACLELSEQAVVEEIIVRPMEGDIHE